MKELGTVVRQGRVYLIATFAGRASAIGLLPLYGYKLSPAEFGVMALLLMFNELLGMLARMGMFQAMLRIYFDSDEDAHRHRVIATAMAITLGMCGLILLAAWPMGGVLETVLQIEGFATAATYALCLLAATVLFGTVSAVFMLRKQPAGLAWSNAAKSLLVFGLTALALLAFEGGVTGVMIGQALGIGIVSLVLLVREARLSGLLPDLGLARELLRFGLPLVPSAFANAAVQAVDRFFLNLLAGAAVVGPYAMAAKLGHSLQDFVARPLSQVLFVRRYETLAAEEDQGEFHALQVLYLAVLLLGAVGLGLFGPEIIWIVAADGYAAAGPLIGVMGLAFAAAALTQSLEMGLLYAKKTHLVSVIAVIMLALAAPVYWTLIYLYGLTGGALGFLVLNVTRLIITDQLNRRMGTPLIRQDWGRSLRLTGLAVMAYGGAMAMFGGEVSWTAFLAKGVLFVVVAALMLAGPILERRTRVALWALVRQRGKRKQEPPAAGEEKESLA